MLCKALSQACAALRQTMPGNQIAGASIAECNKRFQPACDHPDCLVGTLTLVSVGDPMRPRRSKEDKIDGTCMQVLVVNDELCHIVIHSC